MAVSSTEERRARAIDELMAEAARATTGGGLSRQALHEVEAALGRLAQQPGLFDPRDYPPSADPGGIALYQIHVEPSSGLALYLNVLMPGKSSKPHDHTTWAAIAALQGQECNRVYRRTDDGSVPGRAHLEVERSVVVQPGTTVSFMPEDIHSIHGQGSDEIRHLHLYGRPLDQLDGRVGFDLEAGTVVNYNSNYMTPTILQGNRSAHRGQAAAAMPNPRVDRLPPYPMVRLERLMAEVTLPAGKPQIRLSIGEPRHPLPAVVSDALAGAAGRVGSYPPMQTGEPIRRAITGWLERRFAPARIDVTTEVLPVNGAREGLFSFVQAVLDASRPDGIAVCPNPGYAVYDGATVLSGLHPWRMATADSGPPGAAYDAVPAEVWRRTQLLFVCSPDNPRGDTLGLEDWRTVFRLADEYGFIVVSDECYCEIYADGYPPMGALQAAALLGRGYERLAAFFSLSKRSNAPGLRSGFIAGDAALLRRVDKYRSYAGGGMNQAVEAASIAAWSDEDHVEANRALYREKYRQVIPVLQQALPVRVPRAGFFLWVDVRGTGLDDEQFTRQLLAAENVLVLPGSYLTQAVDGVDPGRGRVRMALVADLDECLEGARRIVRFCAGLKRQVPAPAAVLQA